MAAKKLLNSELLSKPKFILNAPKASIANIPNASIKPTIGCCRANNFSVLNLAFLFLINCFLNLYFLKQMNHSYKRN